MSFNIFFTAPGSATISDPNVSITGAAGAQTVKLTAAATGVRIDPNIERVEFSGPLSAYTFNAVAGVGVQVFSGGVLVATIPSLNQNATFAFTNGSVVLAQTGGAAFTLGGTPLTNSATPAAVTPTTAINAADVSTVISGPAAPTFSVTSVADSATEGANATFTVSLSAAQGTATTVAYTLAGTGGATLGTDTTAQATTGTLTFAPGEVTKTIVVASTFDTIVETGEGVSLTLSAPSTGTVLSATAAAKTVALADPVAPTFTLTSNAVAGAANEEGSTIVYTITPSSVTDKAYTFTLNTVGKVLGGVVAASAADFSPASQTVTFAAGVTAAQTVSQTVFNDGVTEGLEGYETSLLSSTFTVVGNALSGLITDPTSGGTGLSGTTFTLLSTTDNIPGTNGNDTFLGTVTDVPVATDTLTAADNLNGGSGVDTLSITLSGTNNANTIPAATVTAIENINVRALQTTAATITSVTGTNYAGATAFNADRATSAVTFNALAAGQSVGIIGNANVLNGGVNANYANTVTAGVFNISGGTIGGATTNVNAVLTQTGTGITSNTINSTGAANSLNNVVLSGAANVALTINAATNLTTGNITGFTGTTSTITVNGAAASVNLGTIEANTVKTINASGLTAGGVTATLNNNTAIVFTGGAGNDVITAGAVLAAGASVDAAAGTADRLVITADAQLTTVTAPFYKGFEVLQANTGVTADVTQLAANNTITGIRINDSVNGAAVTVNGLNATQAANVAIIAASDAVGAITLGVTGAATGGQIDTVKATLTTTTAAGAAQVSNLTGIVLAGVEKLELTGTGTVAAATGVITLTTAAATSLDSIKLTTVGDAVVTVAAGHTAQNLNIDGSASSGGLTLNGSLYPAGTTTGMSLTGGSGDDILLGGLVASSRDNLTGGAGNDVLIGEGVAASIPTIAAGVATIIEANLASPQTGADVLTGGLGNDSYGFGNSTVATAADLITQADTIVGLNLGTALLAGRVDGIFINGTTAGASVVYTFTAGEQAAITAAATLAAAVDLVYASTTFEAAANTVATFTFGADTYLAFNNAAAGVAVTAGDMIIKITGVTGTLDASDVTVL